MIRSARPRRILLALLAIAAAGASLSAQVKPVPEPYKAEEFSPFLRDLRRFEIVSIGSFPLTVFYSTFCYDSYRFVAKSAEAGALDPRFLPWPLKGPDYVPMNKDEKTGVLIAAAGASIVVGVLDYLILKERLRAESRRQALEKAQAALGKAKDGAPPAASATPSESAAAPAPGQ
jgi:hypothetical protein